MQENYQINKTKLTLLTITPMNINSVEYAFIKIAL